MSARVNLHKDMATICFPPTITLTALLPPNEPTDIFMSLMLFLIWLVQRACPLGLLPQLEDSLAEELEELRGFYPCQISLNSPLSPLPCL